jgi:hypothetical protein
MCSCILCTVNQRSAALQVGGACNCMICVLNPRLAPHHKPPVAEAPREPTPPPPPAAASHPPVGRRITSGEMRANPSLVAPGSKATIVEAPAKVRPFARFKPETRCKILSVSTARVVIRVDGWPSDHLVNPNWVFDIDPVHSDTLSLGDAANACRSGRVVECVESPHASLIGVQYRYSATRGDFDRFSGSGIWEPSMFPHYPGNTPAYKFRIAENPHP